MAATLEGSTGYRPRSNDMQGPQVCYLHGLEITRMVSSSQLQACMAARNMTVCGVQEPNGRCVPRRRSSTDRYDTRRRYGAQDAKRLGELVMQQAEQYIANML